jgi:hypothetical protein
MIIPPHGEVAIYFESIFRTIIVVRRIGKGAVMNLPYDARRATRATGCHGFESHPGKRSEIDK